MSLPLQVGPTDTTDDLLKAIREAALTSGPNHPGLTLAPFAALQIKLAEQADRTAQRLEHITRRLLWGTIGILVVSLLLLLQDAVKSYGAFSETEGSKSVTNSQAQMIQPVFSVGGTSCYGNRC
jgi:hypothetical protein